MAADCSCTTCSGPAAEDWTAGQIMRAVETHDAMHWCLKLPGLLEMQRDDSLLPLTWFVLTPSGDAYIALRSAPTELCTPVAT